MTLKKKIEGLTLLIHYHRLQYKWCLEDTWVKGQFIPKGACVFINKHWLHFDPDVWGPEDVRQFVPERYMYMYKFCLTLVQTRKT